jgi:hypothetical protein
MAELKQFRPIHLDCALARPTALDHPSLLYSTAEQHSSTVLYCS